MRAREPTTNDEHSRPHCQGELSGKPQLILFKAQKAEWVTFPPEPERTHNTTELKLDHSQVGSPEEGTLSAEKLTIFSELPDPMREIASSLCCLSHQPCHPSVQVSFKGWARPFPMDLYNWEGMVREGERREHWENQMNKSVLKFFSRKESSILYSP